MRRFLATEIAAVLVVSLILFHFGASFDLVNIAGSWLQQIPSHHWDEVIIGALLIVGGLGIDFFVAKQRKEAKIVIDSFVEKERQAAEIRSERLSVFRATMRSTQELVNDALNQMQLFIIEGEGLIPETSLNHFNDLIHRTAAELTVMANLQSTIERDTPLGQSIDCKSSLIPAGSLIDDTLPLLVGNGLDELMSDPAHQQ